MKNTPFLIRNLSSHENRETAKQDVRDCSRVIALMKELHFYHSLFHTHFNSVVFNLHVKTIDGKKVWIDPIREHHKLPLLDKDEEVEEWLKPTRVER